MHIARARRPRRRPPVPRGAGVPPRADPPCRACRRGPRVPVVPPAASRRPVVRRPPRPPPRRAAPAAPSCRRDRPFPSCRPRPRLRAAATGRARRPAAARWRRRAGRARRAATTRRPVVAARGRAARRRSSPRCPSCPRCRPSPPMSRNPADAAAGPGAARLARHARAAAGPMRRRPESFRRYGNTRPVPGRPISAKAQAAPSASLRATTALTGDIRGTSALKCPHSTHKPTFQGPLPPAQGRTDRARSCR